MNEIKKNLLELYNLKTEINKKGKEHAVFTCMVGKRYGQDDDNVQFMVVGRCANGWDEDKDYRDADAAERFSEHFIQNFTDYMNRDCYSWIIEENGKQRSKNNDSNGKPYNCETSRFWTYTRGVFHALGTKTDYCRIWQDKLVQSDLYKISPREKGNPSSRNMKKQEDICKRMLKSEIEFLRPTHVLFETETYRHDNPENTNGGWLFEDIKTKLKIAEYSENRKYIRYYGYYSLKQHKFCTDEGEVKIVVAVHPGANGITKADYVKQCTEVFESL